MVEEIARKEQLITSSKIEQVRKLVQRILDHSCCFGLKAEECLGPYHACFALLTRSHPLSLSPVLASVVSNFSCSHCCFLNTVSGLQEKLGQKDEHHFYLFKVILQFCCVHCCVLMHTCLLTRSLTCLCPWSTSPIHWIYPPPPPTQDWCDIFIFVLWILVQYNLLMIFWNVNVLAFLLRVFKLMSLS